MLNQMVTRAACWLLVLAVCVQARSYSSSQQRSVSHSGEDESLAVIPSPNDGIAEFQQHDDIERVATVKRPQLQQHQELHLAAPSETSAPVYVSPFFRPERATAANSDQANLFDASSESSHAPLNYAPKPAGLASSQPMQPTKDLKAAASYGHDSSSYGGHGYGDNTSGWLDMGAWTGGKGSFGWYADYPVGGSGKHHYGRRRR